MTSFKSVAALSALALVSACTSPVGPGIAFSSKSDEHAAHHPDAGPGPSMPAMRERMKAMREMHDRMMNARTPVERQALKADHMKAMQGGMDMMKGMGSGMGSGMDMMKGMGMGMGMGSGMVDGKGTPADMTRRQQMMEGRMDMMQTMMEMMMQRLPDTPAAR